MAGTKVTITGDAAAVPISVSGCLVRNLGAGTVHLAQDSAVNAATPGLALATGDYLVFGNAPGMYVFADTTDADVLIQPGVRSAKIA